MAIPIIGAPKAEAESSPLPIADVDLPPPGTAPAGHASLSEARVKELLAHPHPLVRAFAVEQVASRPGDSWSQALLPLIDDADPEVASDALRALEERKYQPAAEAIAARFLSGGGEVAARAASALGTLAPEKLLAALKHRGRLDDEAYGATAAALAVIGTPEVVDFLDKALNRSGALSPERRGSLYGAALLSGSGQLAHRVLSVALEDSKRQEPDGASFPSRSALAGVAGMPIPLSRRAEGLAVFDGVRETITQDLLPKLEEKDRPALEEAMGKKRVERLLDALRVVLELKIRDEHPDDYGSIPRRRRGLLAALLERKEEIGKLELDAAAIFAAAAVQAAMFIVSDGSDEGSSPALSGLAKALESPGIDGPKLAAMSGDELAALFKDKTERQMRRVVTILSREAVHHPSTLKRIAAAIVRAGHGMGLLEAAAEVEDPRVHQGVLIALSDAQADREQIVVDALTRTPVEPKLARLALLLAEEVRTERVALAIGRRFYDFRQLARTELIRAALRNGDPRLSPLLASRAFKDEPEEVAWALMMVAQGADGGEKLADALARAERAHRGDAPQRREVVVPLACKRCNEVLAYHFERVILDIESGDQLGDPAFVGDVRCRACGVEDQLEPTEEAGRILVAHMMEFIEASRRGQPTQSLLVTPGQTDVHGKRVGLAKALRMTSEEIERSPAAIRPRLLRARLRMVLRRPPLPEDLEAVFAADPRSPEGIAIKASMTEREGDPAKAAELTAEAIRLLSGEHPARVYDAADPARFKATLEDYLVSLERGAKVTVPADLDLAAARRRRDELEQRLREELERRNELERAAEEEEDEERAPAPRPLTEEELRSVGRNDPCPCGSGQKFKRCHGRGR